MEVLHFAAPGTPDGDEHPRFVLTTRASSLRTSGQGAGVCLTWTVSDDGDARGVQRVILRKKEVKKQRGELFLTC